MASESRTDSTASTAAPLELGQQFVEYAGGVAELMLLEARLALASLRPALALSLVLLPLGFLLWVSVSATLAWSAYEYSGTALWGFVAFTLVQLSAVILCCLLLRRYRSRLSFRESRRQISIVIGSLHREIEQAGETNQPES